jgi:hypothetical protein
MVCNVHGKLLDAVESRAWHAEQGCRGIWNTMFFYGRLCYYTESCGIVLQAVVLYRRLVLHEKNEQFIEDCVIL